MKKLFILGVLLTSTYTFAQNKTAVTEDGKKVILKSDKTWEYVENKKRSSVKGTPPKGVYPGI